MTDTRALREAEPMNGSELIAWERERQVAAEGWTPEHDDAHYNSELAMAGAAYAAGPISDDGPVPPWWPFEREAYRPTPDDRVRELAKAGALIAAEIDRLRRAYRA